MELCLASGGKNCENATNAMSENNDFALVPRAAGAIEKTEPGARCILSSMVADTLALMKQNSSLDTRQKILVVLDDPDLADMYQEILVEKLPGQPTVHAANSLPLALAKLEAEPFQLIITGLKFPKMNGFDLLAIVRRKYPGLRTVVLTTETDEQFQHFRLRAYAFGVDGFWSLPATEEESKVFLKRLQPLLERKSSRPPRKRPLKIIILDDEPAIQDTYRMLLQDWYEGVVIVQCHSGKEALAELSRADPDLFITDWAHPGIGMRHGDILERLAERKAKFPIFLISAETSLLPEAALRSARENLNFSSWDKPLDVYQFQQALESALGIPAQQEP